MKRIQKISTGVKAILGLAVLVTGLGFRVPSVNNQPPVYIPEPYLVKDITPGTEGSELGNLTHFNGELFFEESGDLWKSDGTEAGTLPVSEFSNIQSLTVANGMLFFVAEDEVHGRELWVSDGSEAGTHLVKDINPGGGEDPGYLRNVDGTLFFQGDDAVHGRELWKSDGTEAGTVLVKDIKPGAESSLWIPNPVRPPFPMVAVNDKIFFNADDGIHGFELWVSDGTEAGTLMVKDINPGSVSTDIRCLRNVNGTLFFGASDGIHGYEMWLSDGTEAGTYLVKDINPGSGHSVLCGFFFEGEQVNGTFFFDADDGVHGRELWVSDGSEAGTVLVKDIKPGPEGSIGLIYQTKVNGTLFFSADDGVHSWELWKSDGTEAGTVMVKDIAPGSKYSDPINWGIVNSTLFFSADDRIHGMELWVSDGSEAGTVMVKDIAPGEEGSEPEELTNVNRVLFFTADDRIYGRELWALGPLQSIPPVAWLPLVMR